MTNKAPMTRRGIYLTEQQWADAKAPGDANYSAGVRRSMDERVALQKDKATCDANLELIDKARSEELVKFERHLADLGTAQVERDATIERYIDANGELVLQVEALAAAPTYLVRGRWFVFGWLAGFVVSALALAVLEGIDKAWWGWML